MLRTERPQLLLKLITTIKLPGLVSGSESGEQEQNSLPWVAESTTDTGNASDAQVLVDAVEPLRSITKEEKKEIIRIYARLFCKHFRQRRFKDELSRMTALTRELGGRAQGDLYPSIWALHVEWDLQSQRYLRHNLEYLSKIQKEKAP